MAGGAARTTEAGGRSPSAAPPSRSAHLWGGAVRKVLIRLWYLCDCTCGKRLVPAIRALLPVYQRWGELKVQPAVGQKLLCLSAATADRLLRDERTKLRTVRGRTHTHPAAPSLLRQIPLRTFDEWDRSVLGLVQADLVGHDGGRDRNYYLSRLWTHLTANLRRSPAPSMCSFSFMWSLYALTVFTERLSIFAISAAP